MWKKVKIFNNILRNSAWRGAKRAQETFKFEGKAIYGYSASISGQIRIFWPSFYWKGRSAVLPPPSKTQLIEREMHFVCEVPFSRAGPPKKELNYVARSLTQEWAETKVSGCFGENSESVWWFIRLLSNSLSQQSIFQWPGPSNWSVNISTFLGVISFLATFVWVSWIWNLLLSSMDFGAVVIFLLSNCATKAAWTIFRTLWHKSIQTRDSLQIVPTIVLIKMTSSRTTSIPSCWKLPQIWVPCTSPIFPSQWCQLR